MNILNAKTGDIFEILDTWCISDLVLISVWFFLILG